MGDGLVISGGPNSSPAAQETYARLAALLEQLAVSLDAANSSATGAESPLHSTLVYETGTAAPVFTAIDAMFTSGASPNLLAGEARRLASSIRGVAASYANAEREGMSFLAGLFRVLAAPEAAVLDGLAWFEDKAAHIAPGLAGAIRAARIGMSVSLVTRSVMWAFSAETATVPFDRDFDMGNVARDFGWMGAPAIAGMAGVAGSRGAVLATPGSASRDIAQFGRVLGGSPAPIAVCIIGSSTTLPTGRTRVADIPERVAEADRLSKVHGASVVLVDEYALAGGERAWEVTIPGTQSPSPLPGNPLDLYSASLLNAGDASPVTAAVKDALRQAGAQPGDHVSLAGHSQGGQVVSALLADGEFWERYDVRGGATLGAPNGNIRLPDDARALNLLTDEDPLARLSGVSAPVTERHMTVRFDITESSDAADFGAPGFGGGHTARAYDLVADRVEESGEAGLAQFREAYAGPTQDAKSVTRHTIMLTRDPVDAACAASAGISPAPALETAPIALASYDPRADDLRPLPAPADSQTPQRPGPSTSAEHRRRWMEDLMRGYR